MSQHRPRALLGKTSAQKLLHSTPFQKPKFSTGMQIDKPLEGKLRYQPVAV